MSSHPLRRKSDSEPISAVFPRPPLQDGQGAERFGRQPPVPRSTWRGTRPAAGTRAESGLEGIWVAVEAERDGAAAAELVGHRLTFAGERFTIEADGKPIYAGTFRTDPQAQPTEIDFVQDEGEAAGQTWLGIYRLDGEELAICDNAPDTAAPRPAEFATSPGSGHVLLTFRR